MYQFRDVNEVGAVSSLPTEAVMINGEYIEDESSSIYIEGYRTLYTKGRESLKKTLTTSEIGSMDGTVITKTKYPEREITVGFQLIAEDSESFRTAFNKLNKILDKEESQFIFHDEEDVYFIGTPYMELDADTGKNAITGEWTIYCSDPFKYSVEEYQATSFVDTDGKTTMMIDYGGTVPAHPTFRVDFYSQKATVDETNVEATDYVGNEDEAVGSAGDCGYVAFFDSDEHILQFGDPDYSVVQPTAPERIYVSQTFNMAGNYSDSVQQIWKPNQEGTGYGIASVNPIDGSFAEAYSYYRTPSETTTGKVLGWKWSGGKWVVNAVSDSSTSKPDVSYYISYKAYNRTASSVKLTMTICCKVGTVASSVKANWKKAKLEGVFTIKDKDHSKVLKAAKTEWKKGTKTITYDFTVSDLEASTVDLACKFKVNESGAKGSAGKLSSRSTNTITIPAYVDKDPYKYFLKPSSYGTVVQNQWHGTTICRTIEGKKNFKLNGTFKFMIGSSANDVLQCGMMEILVQNAKNNIISGIRFVKSAQGKTGRIEYLADLYKRYTKSGYTVEYKEYTEDDATSYYDLPYVFSMSRDEDNIITWKVGTDADRSYTLTTCKDDNATRIIVGCYQFGAQPPMDWIGIDYISGSFWDSTAETTSPAFTTGDVLIAGGGTATVTLANSGDSTAGTLRPDLGALGNDWETLVLNEGTNEIHSAYSDWAGQTTMYRQCKSDDSYGRDYFAKLDASVPYDENMTYYDSSHTEVHPTQAEYEANPTSYYQFMDAGTDATIYYGSSSGKSLSTQPTYEEFTATPTNYYVAESTAPKFSISYREVFI
jgi:predicted phage tail component-like protein